MSYVALENSDQYSILMQSLRISYIFKSYSPLYHSLLDHLHLSTDLTLCFLKKKSKPKHQVQFVLPIGAWLTY